jgi:hypothetical protein
MIDMCGEHEYDLEIEEPITNPKNSPRTADEQLVDASEELITGDADDPPLSEESVVEMLNDSPGGSNL